MKKKPKVATYSSMLNYIYQGDDNYDKRLNEFSDAEIKAWEILKILMDRKGFSWWFDDLESGMQNDIFKEIKKQLL